MTSSESFGISAAGAEELSNLQQALYQGQPFRGVRYFNTMVSGPGLNDNLDPDLVYEPSIAAGYWPGAGFEGNSYAAVRLTESKGLTATDELVKVRQIILGAHIGESALDRYEIFLKSNPSIADLAKNAGSLLIPSLIDMCALKNNPFVFLVTGAVVQSNVMPIGDNIASIYYPLGMRPKSALTNLRQAVLRTQREETL
jgi:hypothetical protein